MLVHISHPEVRYAVSLSGARPRRHRRQQHGCHPFSVLPGLSGAGAPRPFVYAGRLFPENFDPGIIPLFKDELGFTDGELEGEYQFWQNWVATRVPEAYPGMREILERYKARGGKIAVVSHSVSDVIRRDYRENGLPEPDLIFGWELPPEHRKPHVWPLEQIMKEFQLAPEQLLMLDDLKPGYDMCRAAGVPFAAAGWANDIPEIEGYMRRNCDYYFKTVAAFGNFLEQQ